MQNRSERSRAYRYFEDIKEECILARFYLSILMLKENDIRRGIEGLQLFLPEKMCPPLIEDKIVDLENLPIITQALDKFIKKMSNSHSNTKKNRSDSPLRIIVKNKLEDFIKEIMASDFIRIVLLEIIDRKIKDTLCIKKIYANRNKDNKNIHKNKKVLCSSNAAFFSPPFSAIKKNTVLFPSKYCIKLERNSSRPDINYVVYLPPEFINEDEEQIVKEIKFNPSGIKSGMTTLSGEYPTKIKGYEVKYELKFSPSGSGNMNEKKGRIYFTTITSGDTVYFFPVYRGNPLHFTKDQEALRKAAKKFNVENELKKTSHGECSAPIVKQHAKMPPFA